MKLCIHVRPRDDGQGWAVDVFGLGAREDETMGAFLERLAAMAGVVPADVHEHGWQWRPTATDTAFAPPFGTIRQCRGCGCLVAGGSTACVRCAEDREFVQSNECEEDLRDKLEIFTQEIVG